MTTRCARARRPASSSGSSSAGASATPSSTRPFAAKTRRIDRLEAIAWDAYSEGRKAPITRKAGPGLRRSRLRPLGRVDRDPRAPRSRRRRPGPIRRRRRARSSSAARRATTAPARARSRRPFASPAWSSEVLGEREGRGRLPRPQPAHLRLRPPHPSVQGLRVDGDAALPLAVQLLSEPFARPGQRLDERDLRALGRGARDRHRHADALVLRPPSALKLMIDRLVCADGGNPDPTSTHGKNPAKAKAIELAGWDYPKHLAGRVYGLVVHGDVAGIEGSRRALSDWLDWMGLIDAGDQARLDRYIGYYEPYATSHDALDRDQAVQEETRNVARAVARVTRALRSGALQARNATTCPDRVRSDFAALAAKIGLLCGPDPDSRDAREPDPAENPRRHRTDPTRRARRSDRGHPARPGRGAHVAAAPRDPRAEAPTSPATDRPTCSMAWCARSTSSRPPRSAPPRAAADGSDGRRSKPTTCRGRRAAGRGSPADRPLHREQLHRRSRHAQLQAVRAGRLRGSRLAAGRHAARLHPEPGRLRRRHAHERAGPGAGPVRPLPGAGAALERAQVLELVPRRRPATRPGRAGAARRHDAPRHGDAPRSTPIASGSPGSRPAARWRRSWRASTPTCSPPPACTPACRPAPRTTSCRRSR